MQPDFSTLKPVGNSQPDFATLQPTQNPTSDQIMMDLASQKKAESLGSKIWGGLATAGNLANDLAVGASKGIASTALGVGELGQGVLDQTAGRVVNAVSGKGFTPTGASDNSMPVFNKGSADNQLTQQYLAGDNTTQKVGKFAEQVGEFLVPGTKIGEATKGFSFLPKVLTRAAGDIAVNQAQSGGNLSQGIITGITSGASQLVAPILDIFKGMLGRSAAALSGKGSDVINAITENPKAATEGLTGNSLQTLKDSANKVRQFTMDVAQGARENYGKALQAVENNYDEVLGGFKNEVKNGTNYITPQKGNSIIVDPEGNKFNLSLKSLKSNITSSLKDFKVQGSTSKGFDFTNSSLNDQEQNILNKVTERINNWTDVTPTGINTLRQVVADYARPESAGLKRANSIIYNMASSIGDYIGKRVPQVEEMNTAFSKEMKFVDELNTHLSSLGQVDDPRGLKQTMSKIQGIFNANKDMARDVLSKIPGGQDLISREAGRQLSSEVPRTGATFSGKLSGLINSVISPKAIGKTVIKTQQLKQFLEPLTKHLDTLAPTERGAFINVINGLFGGQNQQ